MTGMFIFCGGGLCTLKLLFLPNMFPGLSFLICGFWTARILTCMHVVPNHLRVLELQRMEMCILIYLAGDAGTNGSSPKQDQKYFFLNC